MLEKVTASDSGDYQMDSFWLARVKSCKQNEHGLNRQAGLCRIPALAGSGEFHGI